MNHQVGDILLFKTIDGTNCLGQIVKKDIRMGQHYSILWFHHGYVVDFYTKEQINDLKEDLERYRKGG